MSTNMRTCVVLHPSKRWPRPCVHARRRGAQECHGCRPDLFCADAEFGPSIIYRNVLRSVVGSRILPLRVETCRKQLPRCASNVLLTELS